MRRRTRRSFVHKNSPRCVFNSSFVEPSPWKITRFSIDFWHEGGFLTFVTFVPLSSFAFSSRLVSSRPLCVAEQRSFTVIRFCEQSSESVTAAFAFFLFLSMCRLLRSRSTRTRLHLSVHTRTTDCNVCHTAFSYYRLSVELRPIDWFFDWEKRKARPTHTRIHTPPAKHTLPRPLLRNGKTDKIPQTGRTTFIRSSFLDYS